MKKRWFSICMAFCLAITAMTGCGKKSEKEDKKQDVTITVWNYYNGAQLESFNKLVDEFNKTAGKEKGIVVEAASHGSVEDLQNNVLDSINGVAGAEAVPNIFAAYSDTAYEIDQMDRLVDLKQYFTEKELDEYVSGYINEGYFNQSDELKILPIAKSTEILFLNMTDWEKFAQATATSVDELATYEGVTSVAQKDYEWTDALTDTPNDGKAFLFDKEIVRKLWDNYYVPYVKGYFTLSGRFGSDDVKTGTTIAFIGSTSGASFFPEEVSVSDTETYEITNEILPSPVFEGQQPVSVQQGAGMVVTKATKAEEEASVEFLKWFTDDEHNIEFSVESGYLPVKKDANSKTVMEQYTGQIKSTVRKTIETGIETVNSRELYTTSAFRNGSEARNILTYSLSDLARADREKIETQIQAGMSNEEAITPYLSDEYFETWYDKTKSELENCADW